LKWLLLLASSLTLLSCAPTIVDGRYGCATGACPDGFSCWADSLCYEGDDPFGQPCDRDDDCGGNYVCAPGLGTASTEGTYCSFLCDDDDACATLGTNAHCVDDICRFGCRTAEDCPTDTGCHLVPTGLMMPPTADPVCVLVDGGGIAGRIGCDAPPACQWPGGCQAARVDTSLGICTLDCRTDDNCFREAVCVDAFSGTSNSLCMMGCTSDAGCEGDLVCVSLSTGEPTYCMPPAWEGQGGTLMRAPPMGGPPPP